MPKLKRYWLRGSVAGIAVGFIVDIVLFLNFKNALSVCNPSTDSACVPEFLYSIGTFQILASVLLGIALAGLMIGWLYGKVKNKRKDQQGQTSQS